MSSPFPAPVSPPATSGLAAGDDGPVDAAARGLRLLIAIPALDEEASIEATIERCLEARQHIIDSAPVSAVEITVVSDGSTDRTVELASRYADHIKLIVFPKNRGYGAAIQEAWRQSDADLVAFLDADGTCEPRFFAELCRTLVAEDAAVVLGSRLAAASRMPWLRRLGNRLFASMLTLFSAQHVEDTASGMRVVRRSALRRLMPLPSGMHFTPAMSARAVLSGDLRIVEVAMPYAERTGQSKLKVLRDGLRFLRVISEEALRHRPGRLLGLAGGLCLATAVVLMAMPVLHYLRHRSVLEWMIYRFVVSDLAGTLACLLFCSGYVADRIVGVARGRRPQPWALLDRLFASRLFFLLPLLCFTAGGLLVLPSLLELVHTGATYEHWSRFIVMSFLAAVASILIVTRLMVLTVDLVAERVAYLAADDADR